MRLLRSLGCAIALIAAMSGWAEVRVVVEAPREGEVLRGGAQATVSWSAAGLPGFVEEWEAFLSVDGGKYYAYRITPHLELDRQQFTFEVPNVETEHARILIRAGDERREIELESPRTFAIRADPLRAMAEESLEVDDEERGEAAREGDRGVVEWIDGDRDGEHLTPRTARHRPLTVHQRPFVGLHSDAVEESAARIATALRAAASPAIFAARHSSPIVESGHRTGRDVLLAYRRLNL